MRRSFPDSFSFANCILIARVLKPSAPAISCMVISGCLRIMARIFSEVFSEGSSPGSLALIRRMTVWKPSVTVNSGSGRPASRHRRIMSPVPIRPMYRVRYTVSVRRGLPGTERPWQGRHPLRPGRPARKSLFGIMVPFLLQPAQICHHLCLQFSLRLKDVLQKQDWKRSVRGFCRKEPCCFHLKLLLAIRRSPKSCCSESGIYRNDLQQKSA